MARGPGPLEDETRSGRVLVRMPISLHEYLVDRARAECVSLNMFIVSVLAGECGWAKPDDPGPSRGKSLLDERAQNVVDALTRQARLPCYLRCCEGVTPDQGQVRLRLVTRQSQTGQLGDKISVIHGSDYHHH